MEVFTMNAKITFRIAVVVCTIVFLLFMSGCSALTGFATQALGKGEPLVGVDTEVVAGDKQTGLKAGSETKLEDVTVKDNAVVTTNTTGKVTDIAGAEAVTLNEGVEFWQAGLAAVLTLMIGLFAPQFTINRKR
jgi:hypothetical protein